MKIYILLGICLFGFSQGVLGKQTSSSRKSVKNVEADGNSGIKTLVHILI